MQLEINKTYLLLLTAKDIWEAVSKTNSKVGFTSQVFQIKQQIMNIKQGTLRVTRDLLLTDVISSNSKNDPAHK